MAQIRPDGAEHRPVVVARLAARPPALVGRAPAAVTKYVLPKNKIAGVARSTAHRWLAAADIRRGWATQNYYNDNHQAPLVIKQREEYIPIRKELELRQPLWIQLTYRTGACDHGATSHRKI